MIVVYVCGVVGELVIVVLLGDVVLLGGVIVLWGVVCLLVMFL